MKQQEKDWLNSLGNSETYQNWTGGRNILSTINVHDSGLPSFIVFVETNPNEVDILRFFPNTGSPEGGWYVSCDHSNMTYKSAIESLNEYQESK